MRLKAFLSTVDCSHHASFQAFAPSLPSSFRHSKSDRSLIDLSSNPFVSKKLFKSHSLGHNKINSRGSTIRRSCSLNLDDTYNNNNREVGNDKSKQKQKHCVISDIKDQDPSFSHSRFDFLEPMMLGIRPEFPDFPDRQTIMWASVEQKANSLDIPLSLRMIKKKIQLQEGFTDTKELAYCPVKTAFASMVFIIVELQSHALHMRETICHEDLEIIKAKVQKEMHSSFVWLFQQVFSRTPDLMLHVMTLLADFTALSIADQSLSKPVVESKLDAVYKEVKQVQTQIGSLPQTGQDLSDYDQSVIEAEMRLWNSMVEDAKKVQEGEGYEVLDHDTMKYFVSPVSVEIEPDLHEFYHRTDLLYQMNVSQEPNNPLLLCNYAQFLNLFAQDHDRAEECFKRAVQVTPPDTESLFQYANFLWTVRKDMWAAEERFLQALAIEPTNPFYTSRYAWFLWSSGADETCFPLNNPFTIQ